MKPQAKQPQFPRAGLPECWNLGLADNPGSVDYVQSCDQFGPNQLLLVLAENPRTGKHWEMRVGEGHSIINSLFKKNLF